MRTARLSRGDLDYADTGGPRPVLVLLHGLVMNSDLWTEVMAELSTTFRCIAPTLPMGVHRIPVRQEIDLSLVSISEQVEELLAVLDVTGATLIGVDTGGAIAQLLVTRNASRVSRLVLASCEAFDNYPGGISGRALALTGRLPAPMFRLFMRQMQIGVIRRLPVAFGWLTTNGDALTKAWTRTLTSSPTSSGDLHRLLRATPRDARALNDAGRQLHLYPGQSLIIWAAGDRLMPRASAAQLQAALSNSRCVQIEHTRTLIPLDQPSAFAAAVLKFMRNG